MIVADRFSILDSQFSISSRRSQRGPIQPHTQALHLADDWLALLAQVAICARNERVHVQRDDHIRAGWRWR
jgi:hypothetical protein